MFTIQPNHGYSQGLRPLPTVALSPDGQRVASGAWGTIFIWNTITGEKIGPLFSPGRELLPEVRKQSATENLAGRHFTFSPDSTRLVATLTNAGESGIHIWDTTSGELVHTIYGPNNWSYIFSQDGARLFFYSMISDPEQPTTSVTIHIWDTTNWEEIRTINTQLLGNDFHYWSGVNLAINSDGSRVAAVLGDLIRLWDTATGKEVITLPRNTDDRVVKFAFDSDETQLVFIESQHWEANEYKYIRFFQTLDTTTGEDILALDAKQWRHPIHDPTKLLTYNGNVFLLLDTRNGKKIQTIDPLGLVHNFYISPDASRLLAFVGDRIALWDTVTGDEMWSRSTPTWDNDGSVIAFSADGNRVAIGSDAIIYILDTETGEEVNTLRGHQTTFIFSLNFILDDTRLVSWDDSRIHIWDASDQPPMRVLPEQLSNSDIKSGWSPDGTRLAVASGETIYILDTTTREELQVLHTPTPVNTLAFTHDGSRLASVQTDDTIRIWDTASGEGIRTLRGQNISDFENDWGGSILGDGRRKILFSPDGTRLVSTNRIDISLWNTTTGEEILISQRKGSGESPVSFAFSHDGTRLAICDNGGRDINIWDTTNGKEIGTILLSQGDEEFFGDLQTCSLAFSPDGTCLAKAGYGAISIWDTASGKKIEEYEYLRGRTPCLTYNPDGTRLASVSGRFLRLWNTTSRKQVLTFDTQSPIDAKYATANFESITFSRDGNRLIYSDEESMNIWDAH